MTDYLFIISEIRRSVVSDTELFSKINTRFYPQHTTLNADLVFPFIVFTSVGGSPDRDSYEFDSSLFEVIFGSDKGLDESIALYQRFYSVIHRNVYRNSTFSFQITEDSKPMEVSGRVQGKMMYMYSNTWEIKSIG